VLPGGSSGTPVRLVQEVCIKSVRPNVTAGIVIAGATVILANPPTPAEPLTVQRVVNPLVAG